MIEVVMKVDDEFWDNINQLTVFKEQKEIIHCKDCKYWFYFIESEKHHCTESDKHLWDCPIRDADDFCSRGEKKDE